jgi:outer membrane protein
MKRTNTFFMRTGLLAAMMVVLTLGLASAQTDSSYTLQQCIDYALKNNISVKNSEFDEYIAKAQVGEVRGVGLPQISGSAAIIDNPKLQRMFLYNDPAQAAAGGFSFFPPGTPEGVYALPNLFQLRSSADANIQASQLLFSGSYFVGLQAAKTLVELNRKNTTITKAQTVENVTKAFYSVLINEERKKLLDANVANLDSTLREVRAMNQQGFVEKIDVDRLEVTYNNLVVERSKFEYVRLLMKELLKYQMGYDPGRTLSVKGSINDLNTSAVGNADTASYVKRPEYKLLKTQYELEGINLKYKRSQAYPSLAAFAKAGTLRGARSVGGLFDKPIDYGNDQLNDIRSNFYGYWNYGVSLSVPIFSGFSQRYKIQQSKYTMKKIENNMEGFRQSAVLQTNQANISLRSNALAMETQKRNMELAEQVKKVSKIKYQQGVGSNIEVVNAETSYKEAQTNYFNALYEMMVSDIDYKKATGTLYNE